MPFSKLADPIEVARAHAALDLAWTRIKDRPDLLLGSDEAERLRLAVIIAGYAPLTIDEEDLVARAIERFAAQVGNQAQPA